MTVYKAIDCASPKTNEESPTQTFRSYFKALFQQTSRSILEVSINKLDVWEKQINIRGPIGDPADPANRADLLIWVGFDNTLSGEYGLIL